MKYSLFQDTRPGKRPYNEDRLGCWQRDGALLLAVAEGMGGHAHGEVAAQTWPWKTTMSCCCARTACGGR